MTEEKAMSGGPFIPLLHHSPLGQVSGGRESTIGASAASTTGTAPAQAAEPAERLETMKKPASNDEMPA